MMPLRDVRTGRWTATELRQATPQEIADALASPQGRAAIEEALGGAAAVDLTRLADRQYLASLTAEQVASHWGEIVQADAAAHQAAAQEAPR